MNVAVRIVVMPLSWRLMIDQLSWSAPVRFTNGAVLLLADIKEKFLVFLQVRDAYIKISDSGVEEVSETALTEYLASTGPLTDVDEQLLLNHVAIDTPTGIPWLRSLLLECGGEVFLRDESRHDPSVNSLVRAEHIRVHDQLYITIRSVGNSGPAGAHIGWQCRDENTVEHYYDRLKTAGAEIVVVPQLIDESYLIHFRGPDNLVHDFFCVKGASWHGNF